MAVAILMIGSIFSLTACKDETKESVETYNGELAGVWYAEYEATGVVKESAAKDADDDADDEYTYETVIDSYRFNEVTGTFASTSIMMTTRWFLTTGSSISNAEH